MLLTAAIAELTMTSDADDERKRDACSKRAALEHLIMEIADCKCTRLIVKYVNTARQTPG